MWERHPVYRMRVLRDVESLVVELKACREVMMFHPGHNQDHEGHWKMHRPLWE